MGITESQRALLATLALCPDGAVVRGEAQKALLLGMLYREPPILSDVYEMLSGSLTARITDAGRAALASGARPDE